MQKCVTTFACKSFPRTYLFLHPMEVRIMAIVKRRAVYALVVTLNSALWVTLAGAAVLMTR